ncbi:MAG: UDP-N-acetylmuramate--L-alanine ligase [Polyangia bacterium]
MATLFNGQLPNTRIHFIGVGGIGMSGIAEVLLTLGCRVSGTDLKESDATRRLVSLGGVVRTGHDRAHLDLLGGELDVVVVTSAVRPDNPEVAEARRRGIPVIARAEMLAELMRLKYGIAIAGSHGKTTTTSLIATVLRHAGLDPTAVIGGKLPQLGSNARLGQSDYLVAEADESDGSFLHLSPAVAVVTNIDPEHLDHYGDFERLRAAFLDFINKVPFYGRAVLCLDHPEVARLRERAQKRVISYGLAAAADFRAEDIEHDGLRMRFTALRHGVRLGPVELAMPGRHNVQNALATLAVSDFLGIPFSTYSAALAGFQGVGRRFTVRGQRLVTDSSTEPVTAPDAARGAAREVTVIDDYGHHPVEVRATLAGARHGFPSRRIVAVFQPHRFTRTRDLLDDFAAAFGDAALVFVTDIYAAGEPAIPGITAERLCQLVRERGHTDVHYVAQRADVARALRRHIRPGDLVITLGAGDVWQVGEELLSLLGPAAPPLA